MRAACIVISGRRPIIRCESGSRRRKVWSAVAAPLPVIRLSSNSIRGGLILSYPHPSNTDMICSVADASKAASGGRTSRIPSGKSALSPGLFINKSPLSNGRRLLRKIERHFLNGTTKTVNYNRDHRLGQIKTAPVSLVGDCPSLPQAFTIVFIVY